MHKPALVIMAAGMASRFGGDKQITAVGPNGEIIMDYSIHDALTAGFGKIVFVIRPEMEEKFREVIGKRIEEKVDVVYAYQTMEALVPAAFQNTGRTKPWGTAHAVMCTAAHVDGPFGVINADDYYGPQSYRLLYNALINAKSDRDCCMVGYRLGNTLSDHGTVSRGVCQVDGGGHLIGITERLGVRRDADGIVCDGDGKDEVLRLSEDAVASMNMFGVTKAAADQMTAGFEVFLENPEDMMKKEYFLPAELSKLQSEKLIQIKVLLTEDVWFGVTYQEDTENFRRAIKKLIESGLYPEQL